MDVDYIFIIIWIVLLQNHFSKKIKPDDYIVLFSLIDVQAAGKGDKPLIKL